MGNRKQRILVSDASRRKSGRLKRRSRMVWPFSINPNRLSIAELTRSPFAPDSDAPRLLSPDPSRLRVEGEGGNPRYKDDNSVSPTLYAYGSEPSSQHWTSVGSGALGAFNVGELIVDPSLLDHQLMRVKPLLVDVLRLAREEVAQALHMKRAPALRMYLASAELSCDSATTSAELPALVERVHSNTERAFPVVDDRRFWTLKSIHRVLGTTERPANSSLLSEDTPDEVLEELRKEALDQPSETRRMPRRARRRPPGVLHQRCSRSTHVWSLYDKSPHFDPRELVVRAELRASKACLDSAARKWRELEHSRFTSPALAKLRHELGTRAYDRARSGRWASFQEFRDIVGPVSRVNEETALYRHFVAVSREARPRRRLLDTTELDLVQGGDWNETLLPNLDFFVHDALIPVAKQQLAAIWDRQAVPAATHQVVLEFVMHAIARRPQGSKRAGEGAETPRDEAEAVAEIQRLLSAVRARGSVANVDRVAHPRRRLVRSGVLEQSSASRTTFCPATRYAGVPSALATNTELAAIVEALLSVVGTPEIVRDVLEFAARSPGKKPPNRLQAAAESLMRAGFLTRRYRLARIEKKRDLLFSLAGLAKSACAGCRAPKPAKAKPGSGSHPSKPRKTRQPKKSPKKAKQVFQRRLRLFGPTGVQWPTSQQTAVAVETHEKGPP